MKFDGGYTQCGGLVESNKKQDGGWRRQVCIGGDWHEGLATRRSNEAFQGKMRAYMVKGLLSLNTLTKTYLLARCLQLPLCLLQRRQCTTCALFVSFPEFILECWLLIRHRGQLVIESL